VWDDKRKYDRGKIMTAEMLDAGKLFGRYLDVDGDAIPYRTLPATHPSKGSYFTRGSSRDRFAKYSEEGAVYVDNMQRLLRKFDTAKTIVPAPVRRDAKEKTKYGAIYFGSTSPAMDEALHALEKDGIHLNTLRIRAFPFNEEVVEFINAHDQVFTIEQNRDAQMQKLIVNECAIDPARFISILHYDGTPITARFITGAIAERMKVTHKEAAE
jgi:2-oxoglutarate ferredoxin oxidoreductase subunit alpha